MPRKLKTYVTTSGFFDLAVAAPSMKAALGIWGSTSNLFQQGFANETSDADIVKATLAHPGIVLKRPVGSKGAYKENAELPELSVLQNAIKRKRPAEPPKKKTAKAKAKPDSAATRKAAQLYDLAEKRRERDDAREAAQREKERDRRNQAVEKAQAALDEARSRHDARAAEIEKQRDALDRKARLESERWSEEENRLKAALRRARDD